MFRSLQNLGASNLGENLENMLFSNDNLLVPFSLMFFSENWAVHGLARKFLSYRYSLLYLRTDHFIAQMGRREYSILV